MEERVIDRWLVSRLLDDHTNVEILEVRIMADEKDQITNVVIKTMNGLKHYGERIPPGAEYDI